VRDITAKAEEGTQKRTFDRQASRIERWIKYKPLYRVELRELGGRTLKLHEACLLSETCMLARTSTSPFIRCVKVQSNPSEYDKRRGDPWQ